MNGECPLVAPAFNVQPFSHVTGGRRPHYWLSVLSKQINTKEYSSNKM